MRNVEKARTDAFHERRERLSRTIAGEGLDLFVVSNPINVSYLTNFSGESSWLLVGLKRVMLVSDGRFTEQLAEECPGLETHIRAPSKPIHEAAAEVIASLDARNVGFESGHLSFSDYESLKFATPTVNWKAGKDRVEKMRAVKDDTEVAQICEAIGIAERAFAMFRSMLRPQDNEKELCDAMEMYVRRAGGRCTSFPSIVGVGTRAALPHCPPGHHCVHEAELLLVDWGASGRFYKSDLTRVLVPRQNSAITPAAAIDQNSQLSKIYEVVLHAQQAAITALRPGAKSGEIDAAARNVIAEAGYGEFFTHSVGHGIGMQVHEMPMMRAGTEILLQAGMVVTVEPGIYISGWGGVRIEDDVLLTPDGCEVLTKVPKDLSSMVVEW